MSKENGILPFQKHIPHDYDYEDLVNPLLPNPATTTLFNDEEKTILGNPFLLANFESGSLSISNESPLSLQTSQAVARYQEAKRQLPSSKFRNKVMKPIRNICSFAYPAGYHAIREFLDEQIDLIYQGIHESNSLLYNMYEDLLATIDAEFRPPSYTRIYLRLKSHAVFGPDDYIKQKGEFEEEMKIAFVKGADNIFYLENIDGSRSEEKEFQRTFQQYNSFRMAFLFGAFFLTYGKIPTISELENLLQEQEEKKRDGFTDHTWAYLYLVYDVLDSFISQGYQIREISEKPKHPLSLNEEIDRAKSFEDAERVILMVKEGAQQRDINIAEELTELTDQAEEQKRPTNIYGLFGADHHGVIDKLPLKLKVITASKRTKALQLRVPKSESIDEEEWKAALEQ